MVAVGVRQPLNAYQVQAQVPLLKIPIAMALGDMDPTLASIAAESLIAVLANVNALIVCGVPTAIPHLAKLKLSVDAQSLTAVLATHTPLALLALPLPIAAGALALTLASRPPTPLNVPLDCCPLALAHIKAIANNAILIGRDVSGARPLLLASTRLSRVLAQFHTRDTAADNIAKTLAPAARVATI